MVGYRRHRVPGGAAFRRAFTRPSGILSRGAGEGIEALIETVGALRVASDASATLSIIAARVSDA